MQLQGSHTFQAPKQVVWDALMDPTILATALPGGEALEKVGENEYKAAMKVRVGPVQGKFDGGIELTDINELESYKMKVNGQGTPGFVNGEGDVRLEETDGGTIMHYSGDVQVGGKIAGVGQRLIDSTAKSMIRQGLSALDAQIQILAAEQMAVPSASTADIETVADATISDDAGVVNESDVAATPPASTKAGTTASAAATTPPTPAHSSPARPSPARSTPPPVPSTTEMAANVAKDVARDLVSDVIPLKHQEKVLWFVLGAVAMWILSRIF